jgi:putative RecB family exonuclease
MTEALTPRLPTGLSPSSISTYMKCPRRFMNEKILGQRSPGSVDSVLGTFVHRSLELLMERPAAKRTMDNWKVDAKTAWGETIVDPDFIQLNLGRSAQKDFRARALKSAHAYFGMEDPTEVDVVATEQEMSCVIEGVPLRGIVDRLERNDRKKLVVADYKNGKMPNLKFPDSMDDKSRQMNIYAVMTKATMDEEPEYGRLIFTAFGKEICVPYTPSSIEETVAEAVAVWDGVHASFKSDSWAPKTSALCGWCPFLATCPEGLQVVLDRVSSGRSVSDQAFSILKAHASRYDAEEF